MLKGSSLLESPVCRAFPCCIQDSKPACQAKLSHSLSPNSLPPSIHHSHSPTFVPSHLNWGCLIYQFIGKEKEKKAKKKSQGSKLPWEPREQRAKPSKASIRRPLTIHTWSFSHTPLLGSGTLVTSPMKVELWAANKGGGWFPRKSARVGPRLGVVRG